MCADEFDNECPNCETCDCDSDFDNHNQPQDEEAHFYWTVREFESLVDNYGPERIFQHLDGYIVDKIKEFLNHG